MKNKKQSDESLPCSLAELLLFESQAALAEKRVDDAVRLAEQAAHLGSWVAEHNLAEWSYVGLGAPIDYAKSWRHYERSARALAEGTPAGKVAEYAVGLVPQVIQNMTNLFLQFQVPRDTFTAAEPLVRRWAAGDVACKLADPLKRAARLFASFALAHWHYDADRRPEAAAYYRQVIDIHAKLPPDVITTYSTSGTYKHAQANLLRMHAHDPHTMARLLAEGGPELLDAMRYQTPTLPVPTVAELLASPNGLAGRVSSRPVTTIKCGQDPLPLLRCACCGKEALQLLRCGKCKDARYCNAACQGAHWKEHKRDCRAPGV